MTIPLEDNLHYISGGRQARSEEKAAVNTAESTMLMLLEGFGEEGLWLSVQAGQRILPMKSPMACTQDLQDCSLTRSAPRRDAYVKGKLELDPQRI